MSSHLDEVLLRQRRNPFVDALVGVGLAIAMALTAWHALQPPAPQVVDFARKDPVETARDAYVRAHDAAAAPDRTSAPL